MTAGRGVRVDPPFLEFKDIKVGEVYRRPITVTNVGKVSRKIFVEKPELKVKYLQIFDTDFFFFSIINVEHLLADVTAKWRPTVC